MTLRIRPNFPMSRRMQEVLIIFNIIIFIGAASPAEMVDSHNLRPGDNARFTIDVANTGETTLNPVEVVDILPEEMSYISDDRLPAASLDGKNVTWSNVGPLDIGESTSINLVTKIADTASGRLINKVSITGTPVPEGYNISSSDEEYVDIMPREVPQVKRNVFDKMIIGDQVARGYSGGRASNSLRIISNE